MNVFRSMFGSDKNEHKTPQVNGSESLEKPVGMLRGLPWLSSLDEDVFQKVVAGFEWRWFPEGATILKEEDPDNGLFVIISGDVSIEIRGVTMDVLGPGNIIGEMSVLTGYPRSASIVAVNPVSVVWIESDTLKSIMKRSADLENRLWEFASKRFAMNLLGRREPYNHWEQNIFIQWLAAGEVKVPDERGFIKLKGKIGVLVTGTAAMKEGGIITPPASLTGSNYVFSKDARVFIRDK